MLSQPSLKVGCMPDVEPTLIVAEDVHGECHLKTVGMRKWLPDVDSNHESFPGRTVNSRAPGLRQGMMKWLPDVDSNHEHRG